jgi:ATP-dependent Zn protease
LRRSPALPRKLMVMEAPYDEATAYHEAGHAVLALAVGRPVHRVSVLPNRERLGICEFRKGVFRPTKDWLEEEILISLGGIAAEARHTGAYAWEEAERDMRYVRRLAIQRAGERQAQRLERRLLAKAEHMLCDDELWRAVERIAADLVRLGTISGRAVRHFFDQSREQS